MATKSSRSAPPHRQQPPAAARDFQPDGRSGMPAEARIDSYSRHYRRHGARPADIDVVLPAFHEFCEDTVLIAHNAAFDMRFLQLKEERTGIKFNQPVLDTLLLSAVAHPNQESHKLDVILERLGIHIDSRHNALEDRWPPGRFSSNWSRCLRKRALSRFVRHLRHPRKPITPG
jgi:DNA polymerase I-like protein with 3'-5' exonuclease and polymerase domains